MPNEKQWPTQGAPSDGRERELLDNSGVSREATVMGGSSDEKPWDVRILEVVPSGVDGTLIEENLRLSPTERLEKMRAVLIFIDDARNALELLIRKAEAEEVDASLDAYYGSRSPKERTEETAMVRAFQRSRRRLDLDCQRPLRR